MARLHFVQKARKAVKAADIAVGDSYYWWKFRHGPKRYSKTRPKESQLTQSAYKSQLLEILERIEELEPGEHLADDIQQIADDLRSLGEEQSDNRDSERSHILSVLRAMVTERRCIPSWPHTSILRKFSDASFAIPTRRGDSGRARVTCGNR